MNITNRLKSSLILIFGFFVFTEIIAQTSRNSNSRPSTWSSNFIRLDVGFHHAMEIRGDTLYAWGGNENGQLGDGTDTNRSAPTRVFGSGKWATVSAGGFHTLAITNRGSLYAWGYNFSGQVGNGGVNNQSKPQRIGTDSNWVSVSAGGFFSIALKANGTLWSWGSNSFGQLGDGKITNTRTKPYQVGTDKDWVYIVAGTSYAMAIKSDGSLWAWGDNRSGQLGENASLSRTKPYKIGNYSDWISVQAGEYHSSGLRSDGSLWSWGANSHGELGDGTKTMSKIPVKIGGEKWAKIFGGDSAHRTFGIKSNGTLWAWGSNIYGDLGIGKSTFGELIPVRVGTDSNWVRITTSGLFTFGQKSNGTLVAWGNNDVGQLANSTSVQEFSAIKASSVESKWSKIALGGSHTLGLKSNGTLWVWGNNDSGQLGLEMNTSKYNPMQIRSKSDWVNAASGTNHSIALKTNGTLWSWGANGLGQLGDGSKINRNYPKQIDTNKVWLNIAVGNNHNLAIAVNGKIYGWGDNTYGQLGDGTAISKSKPTLADTSSVWIAISAGAMHSAGLKMDGTIWTWGNNNVGQLGDSSLTKSIVPYNIGTGTKWTNIQCGATHTLAIKTDGSLWAWGLNDKGQIGDGTLVNKKVPVQIGTDTNWISIIAGESHSIGLKSDGTIWVWGNNAKGQLGDGTNTSKLVPTLSSSVRFLSVFAKGNQTIGIKSERETYCAVGDNQKGQLGDGTTTDRNNFTCNTHAAILPEIEITGKNKIIIDGQSVCNLSDGTDFGNVVTGTTKLSVFKIYNKGTDTLRNLSFLITGKNALNYSASFISYSRTLVAGDSTAITVGFKPAQTGLKTATITISSNDGDEGKYDFDLQGNGIAPEIDVKGNGKMISDGDSIPSNIDFTDFGETPIKKSISKTFNIVNSGTDTLRINGINLAGINKGDFSVPTFNYPIKINGGDSIPLKIDFSPTVKGLRKATIIIVSNDLNEANYDFAIQGIGTVPEILVTGNGKQIANGDITPSPLDKTDFGKSGIGKTSIQSYQIFNKGKDTLKINSILISGTQYYDFKPQINTYPLLINVGDSLTFELEFMPLSTGVRNATVTISNNDSTKFNYNFSISGIGVTPEINVLGNFNSILDGATTSAISNATDFDKAQVNKTKSNTFKIINTGSDTLIISKMDISGSNSSEFNLQSLSYPLYIKAGDSFAFVLNCTPINIGIRKASINIYSNDTDELVFDFAVQCNGVSSQIQVVGNHSTIANGDLLPSINDHTDFGSVKINDQLTYTYTVKNVGTSDLIIQAVEKSGIDTAQFSVSTLSTSSTILVNDSATFLVTFKPNAVGLKTVKIEIKNNDFNDSIFEFAIQGNGNPNTRIEVESWIGSVIKIYPNPASNFLKIEWPKEATNTVMKLLSLDGKLLINQTISESSNLELDITHLSNGIYVLELNNGGVIYTSKICIQR
ncbi:MAG: choice-of-anchor D domain-containing protein [bacterium]|nr:choice-of-anchor D domain-containing protein [bacterium]